jgi:hypothetical protein
LKKPEPTLGEGEVLIRVKAWWVKICFVLIYFYPMFKLSCNMMHILCIKLGCNMLHI